MLNGTCARHIKGYGMQNLLKINIIELLLYYYLILVVVHTYL